jgi:epoxyqueuosine reductase
MPIISSHLARLARQAAAEAGFELCGVASTSSGQSNFAELEYFSRWIAQGYAGEMEYLKARNQQGELRRGKLSAATPWARSVIVCGMNYNSRQPYSTECASDSSSSSSSSRGWVARYAISCEDYHDVLLRALLQVEDKIRRACANDACGERDGEDNDNVNASASANGVPPVRPALFRSYVDTGPLVERVFARYAGVGWIGKNTCIINQQIGSWIFLGVILTSLEMQPDLPASDRCGACTRCIEACPTQAIREPYHLDATRCISYLTIEKRGQIPEDLRAGMGNHLFGCDICQDVCPWNGAASETRARNLPVSANPGLQPRKELVNPALEWIAEMSAEQFQQTFRHSPIKRAKYSGLRRNAAIAMGNSGNAKFLPTLEKLSSDADSTVAEHARWALSRLRGGDKQNLQPRFVTAGDRTP